MLFAVSAQKPDQSRALIKKHDWQFEILYDPFNDFAMSLDLVHGFSPELKRVYQGFGIDLTEANGQHNWMLAMPTRMVVDGDHKIKSINYHPDYKLRPEPSETLEVLTSR